MDRDAAQTLALEAAAWLASDRDMLAHFLNATGMDGGELRASLAAPETLAALLDFILLEDAWVLDCAAACGVPPTALVQARAALPGGAIPNWT